MLMYAPAATAVKPDLVSCKGYRATIKRVKSRDVVYTVRAVGEASRSSTATRAAGSNPQIIQRVLMSETICSQT